MEALFGRTRYGSTVAVSIGTTAARDCSPPKSLTAIKALMLLPFFHSSTLPFHAIFLWSRLLGGSCSLDISGRQKLGKFENFLWSKFFAGLERSVRVMTSENGVIIRSGP